VFPNPFVGRLTISYQLEREQPVSFNLYDAVGNRVAGVGLGVQAAGTHSLHPNVAGLAPGVYFCELVTPTESRTYRLVKAQ